MKKLAFIIIPFIFSLFLTACAKVIAITETEQMYNDELSEALSGHSLEDIKKAWADSSVGSCENGGELFTVSDKRVWAIFGDEDGNFSHVRNCFWCEGGYVRGKSCDMVLLEMNGYVEATTVSGDEVSFESFEDGDRIRILVADGIAESYPCQAQVYRAELIEKGSYDELDKNEMEQIREMGWVE